MPFEKPNWFEEEPSTVPSDEVIKEGPPLVPFQKKADLHSLVPPKKEDPPKRVVRVPRGTVSQ